VDEKVRQGAELFKKLRATIEGVSIPMHLLGPAMWTPIGVEDITQTMMCGDDFGHRRLIHHVGRAHSFVLAKRAPSARAPSFAQAIAGTTVGAPAKVAKPQSTPAMTFSRPTTCA